MTATETLNPALPAQIQTVAQAAGLQVLSSEPSTGTTGLINTRFTLALAADHSKTQTLELSQSFDPARYPAELAQYLADAATRLRNPRPDCFLTANGLPLSFSNFAWPFHESTAGADTSLVHGQSKLEDGEGSVLFSKLSASMTVTFRDIVPAPEQPFCESFIYNAIRKTYDQGQLELVKSGNRQPVIVTIRYYSHKQKKFTFTDTDEAQRTAFLAAKVFWLSGTLGRLADGQFAPVWLFDPMDAQYLNASRADLKISAEILVEQGLIALAPDAAFASPTPALMARAAEYHVDLADALAFIKPTFNESMRGGHTNM